MSDVPPDTIGDANRLEAWAKTSFLHEVLSQLSLLSEEAINVHHDFGPASQATPRHSGRPCGRFMTPRFSR